MTATQDFRSRWLPVVLCALTFSGVADRVSATGFAGDANGDGFVDLADLPYWDGCATAPGAGGAATSCAPLDFDTDEDIDLVDFSQYLNVFLVPICGNGIIQEGELCDDAGESANCDVDCTPAECGDDVVNVAAGEQCDDGNGFNGDGCRANCTLEVCGDSILDAGEDCDPPDAAAFCGSTCQYIISGLIQDDNCGGAAELSGEGLFSFDNYLATPDGPAHTGCTFFGEDQIDHDVWGCWTSPCTGTVLLETCDFTTIDTKIAVYDGCGCPGTDARLLSCSDDACLSQTRLIFPATAGSSYLIRLGTFPPRNGGFGLVKITCGVDNCPGEGDCFASSDSPGCNDASCCEKTCERDPFCCTTQWDEVCAEEALGYCEGAFSVCGPGTGSCTAANGSPGCDDEVCCNAVCRADPLCCLETWDAACAEEEAAYCHSSCGPGAGACHAANGTPGCEDPACCDEVCVRDPFCCQIAWDQECVPIANEWCPAP